MRSSTFTIVIALQSLSIVPGAFSQSTNATCTVPSYTWAFNSRNQSPCQVAAYLGGACHNGQWEIPLLAPDQTYLGPTLQTANPCLCSTVYYSLLSACSDCYQREFLRWSTFSTNCTAVFPSVFPEEIPSGTAVPAWAYLDVVTSDQYNATAAQLDSAAPESTSAPQSTGTIFSTPGAPIPSASAINVPPPASQKSVAGPVAGGVIGGVAGLALLTGTAIWFFHRRRRQSAGPSEVALTSPIEPSGRYSVPTMVYRDTGMSGSSYLSSQTPKLYDPSDPSTFPSSPGMSTQYTFRTTDQTESSVLSPGGVTHPSTGGSYTGAAEL